MMLHAALRSAHGVPTSLLLTGNPGGPGHQWLRERYISPAPRGNRIIEEEFRALGITSTRRRVYIPSRVTDNKLIDLPAYIGQLSMSGSEALVRAWLLGDWDAIVGAYFDTWDPLVHTVRPFKPPGHWFRFRSFDWGSARPFSVGWWAVAGEDLQPDHGPRPLDPQGYDVPLPGVVRDEEGGAQRGAQDDRRGGRQRHPLAGVRP